MTCAFLEYDECETCPDGEISNAVDSHSCSKCTIGRYAAENKSTCHDCVEGKISAPYGGCEYCPSKFYPSPNKATCLLECSIGNGTDTAGNYTTPTPGEALPDAAHIRIRDNKNRQPTFSSEGVVKGRIEVKPSGETVWGTINGWQEWDEYDAQVACREIGKELGYKLSRSKIDISHTDGKGKIWWTNVGCNGSEETIDSCTKYKLGSTKLGHGEDVGIECTFMQYTECKICPSGKYSDTTGHQSCKDCPAGKHSKRLGGSSNKVCVTCPRGLSTVGKSGQESCTLCPDKLTSEDRSHCYYRKCEKGEYNSLGQCKKCDLTLSR